MKKFGCFFANWKGVEWFAEFIGTEEECEAYSEEQENMLSCEEWYVIREVTAKEIAEYEAE